jgi:hypothetical protein
MASRARIIDPPADRLTEDVGSAPVFVDRTGSRRQWFAIAAVLSAALVALAALVLAAGFFGGGHGVLPGLPDPGSQAGPVAGTPDPSGGWPSGAARTSRPGSPTAGTRTSPTVGAPGAGTSTAPGAPNGQTHHPHPTQTPSKKR